MCFKELLLDTVILTNVEVYVSAKGFAFLSQSLTKYLAQHLRTFIIQLPFFFEFMYTKCASKSAMNVFCRCIICHENVSKCLITQSSLPNKSISTRYSITLPLYLCTFWILYTNQNKMLVNNYDQKITRKVFRSSCGKAYTTVNLPITEVRVSEGGRDT